MLKINKNDLFTTALQLEILLDSFLPGDRAYDHYYSLYVSLRYMFLKMHITGEYRQYLRNKKVLK